MSLCTFEQFCLRSVCSHFKLKWAVCLCQKWNKGTLFLALFRWWGHYDNASPVFSTETEITENYQISSRYIILVDFLSPTANGASDLIQNILSILLFAFAFCAFFCLKLPLIWNEILEHHLIRGGIYSSVVDFNISHCFHQKWLNWPLFPLGSRLELRPTR